jgi:hypothetical protein
MRQYQASTAGAAFNPEETFMQYMLCIFEDEAAYSQEQAWMDIIAAHTTLAQQMTEAGILRGGAGLKPAATATSVRKRSGKVSLHDGPFCETKEQLGGFYLIEVADLETALAWAKRIPMAADGVVEVRALLDEAAG